MKDVQSMINGELKRQAFLKTKKECIDKCTEISEKVSDAISAQPSVNSIINKDMKRQENAETKQKMVDFCSKVQGKFKNLVVKAVPVKNNPEVKKFNQEIETYVDTKKEIPVELPEETKKHIYQDHEKISKMLNQMYGEQNVKVVDTVDECDKVPHTAKESSIRNWYVTPEELAAQKKQEQQTKRYKNKFYTPVYEEEVENKEVMDKLKKKFNINF